MKKGRGSQKAEAEGQMKRAEGQMKKGLGRAETSPEGKWNGPNPLAKDPLGLPTDPYTVKIYEDRASPDPKFSWKPHAGRPAFPGSTFLPRRPQSKLKPGSLVALR